MELFWGFSQQFLVGTAMLLPNKVVFDLIYVHVARGCRCRYVNTRSLFMLVSVAELTLQDELSHKCLQPVWSEEVTMTAAL